MTTLHEAARALLDELDAELALPGPAVHYAPQVQSLRAALAAETGETVRVPREPSEAMIDAAFDATLDSEDEMRGHTDRAEAEMAVHVTALTKPIGELIEAVLRKHHRAVLEAVKELHERCAKAERQRDEAREHSRKWCDDFTKLEPELRRMVEFAKQCQAERDEARADRDQFRVLWERDSRSLSDVIGQRNTARTVAEDNRARYVTAEHERDEALEALRELHEATLAPYPTFEQGAEAQNAWSERIDRARDRARAVIGGRK